MLKDAWSLVRKAWLPLLLAFVLIAGVEFAVNAGLRAVAANMVEKQERLKPDGPTIRAIAIYDLEIPEGYTREEYVQLWDVYDKRVEADNRSIKLQSFLYDLPTLLLTPILMLGLYRVLLAAQREEDVRPLRVFSGFRQGGGRAIWLDVLIGLRYIGILLLWGVAFWLLSLILYGVPQLASIIGYVTLVPLLLWLEYRYALAPLHLADSDVLSTAGDCIRYCLEDGRELSPIGMMLEMWPVLLVEIATVALGALLPENGFTIVLTQLFNAAVFFGKFACFTVFYTDIRAVRASLPTPEEDEGRQRAMTLARGE